MPEGSETLFKIYRHISNLKNMKIPLYEFRCIIQVEIKTGILK